MTANVARLGVVIVDDGRLSRECLSANLASHDIAAGCAWDLPSLFAELDSGLPKVILLNIGTPDSTTLLQVSLDLGPDIRVIVFGLSEDRESEIVSCAEAGVAGLLLRSESFAQLLALIRGTARGESLCSPAVSTILLRRVYAFAGQQDLESTEPSLTAREHQILRLLDEGLSNQEIASRLCVTIHTVKNHVHSLLTKLGVGSRADAVAASRAMRYSNAVAQQSESKPRG